MIEGSCCCGTVKFRLLAAPTTMGTCHCSRCRKVGASTIVFVNKADLQWVQGRDQVTVFKPTPTYKYERSFCKVCGTSLGEILSNEDKFPIAANAIDSDIPIGIQFHEFVHEKPSWMGSSINEKSDWLIT